MTTIRRFRPEDAAPTREVFVDAVHIGAAGRYSQAERLDWVADPAMPDGWGPWLDGHFTLVAEDGGRIAGFMMLEADGYLNMAFVRPDRMGTGMADLLYLGLLAEARRLALLRMTTLASRYAQSFFLRHGWRLAPEIILIGGHDTRDWGDENPMSRAMELAPLPAPDDRRDAR